MFNRLSVQSIIIILLFSISYQISNAAVWQNDPKSEWNDKMQIKYANWVSKKLGTDFFKSLGGPYMKLRLDCADAHYALYAYFSKLEGLPFVIDRGNLSNLTTRFDDIRDPDDRFVAFVRYIAGSFGTEGLAANDTFPISFRSLMPGDLFMYKIGKNGNYTRHTYIIKNINPDGTFDVVYSTQADAKAGRALKRKPTYMFSKAPTNGGGDRYHWGFRRMKPAKWAHLDQDQIPGADFYQYQLAESYKNDPIMFFREVKKANQQMSESPQRLISRQIDGLCGSLKDRIDITLEAQKFLNQTNNQCMGFQDYDAYSTPSRDAGLADDFTNMIYDYKTIAEAGESKKIGNKYLTLLLASLNSNRSDSENEALNQFCKIQFTNDTTEALGYTNIGLFFEALFDLNISFHPNDNIYRRWGFDIGRETTCKQHYGYSNPLSRSAGLL